MNSARVEQLQNQYGQTTMELQQRNDELQRKIDDYTSGGGAISADKDKYENILNNGDDISDYTSDDLDNENMAKRSKYVPPRVKHIHDSSRQLAGLTAAKLNAPNRDDEFKNYEDDTHHGFDETEEEVVNLREKVKELNGTIDNYISTVNRQRQKEEELNKKVEYLQNINGTEEQVAELHNQLQLAKDENNELHQKLKMHELQMPFDEPSQQRSQSENEDSNSNFLFDQTERKDGMDQNGNFDSETARDNEIKLKAANVTIEKLNDRMGEIQDENTRLTKTKMELLDKTSQQIEDMRDELQNMCTQLRQKDAQIKQLIHINKEGYDPDQDEQKSNGDTNIRSSWSNPLGIGSSIKNGFSYMTFGRSKYSSPVHTLGDTKKSKIDLAISTSSEIERLRSIIKVLSTAQTNTQNGITTNNTPNNHNKRNGLMSYYPGGGGLN
mmetsp:Transcript_41640/g.36835  ORF Transcript_41640/g.36835 Transcript_41640/m.36835 type:complete len:440 (-) Transcript_41640:189-1508(-)